MAIDREELSEAEDAIVRTLYELVSNLSGAEIGPLKGHMEARFPWLDADRAAAATTPQPEEMQEGTHESQS